MAKKQNKAEANASKTEEKKPKARKTAKKAEKQRIWKTFFLNVGTSCAAMPT